MLTAQDGTMPAMGTPVFLELGSGVDLDIEDSSAATITSASVSPPANATIYVAMYGRGTSIRTHDSVTSGFSTTDSWVKVEDVTVEDPAGVYHRLSLWRATTTASPGSGTIVGTASGTNFQRSLGAVAVENVGSEVDTASASNTTGTTIAITYSPTATTGDVSIVAVISRGDVSGTLSISDTPTHADNSPAAQSTNFTIAMAYKVSPASTITTSNVTNNQAHLMVGALIRGAA